MIKKKKHQFTDTPAKVDPDKVPDHVYKTLASMVLDRLKTDTDLQDRYESETGKKVFK